MDSELSDGELDKLAAQVAERLPTGQHGDKVMLTRRQLVGAATGTLGVGALISSGVDPATAQAAGSVGTSSDPVDVNAFGLDVQDGATFNGSDLSGVGSLNTNEGENKLDSRPLWSTGDLIVSVSEITTVTTVNGTTVRVFQVPYFIDHNININVPDGDYSNENWLVPPYVGGRARYDATKENANVVIQGNDTTPSNVKIGSFFQNYTGDIFGTLRGVRIEGENPFDNENVAVATYQGHLQLPNVELNNNNGGLLAYGGQSLLQTKRVSVVPSSLSGNVAKVKHNGTIETQPVSNSLVGDCRDSAFVGNGTLLLDPSVIDVRGGNGLLGKPDKPGNSLTVLNRETKNQILPGSGALDHYIYEGWVNGMGKERFDMVVGSYFDGNKYVESARYHPQWRDNTSADPLTLRTNGEPTLPDGGDNIETSTAFNVGSWEITYFMESDPSGGQVNFDLIRRDDNNRLTVEVKDGGNLNLVKVDGGASTQLITGSWPDDTTENKFEVTRTASGDLELFNNGVSQGTATDTFTPGGDRTLRFENNLTGEFVTIRKVILE